jgi:hypothetical protein
LFNKKFSIQTQNYWQVSKIFLEQPYWFLNLVKILKHSILSFTSK